MTIQRHQVLLEWDPEAEVWVTYVPTLNGFSTFGETREEALANTQEAILGYLDAAQREGISLEPAPEAVRIVQKGKLWVAEPVGPGEPLTAEKVRQTQDWIRDRGLES